MFMGLASATSVNYDLAATRGRQAVHEALALAAQGKVSCHVTERPLEEINRYSLGNRSPQLLAHPPASVFEDMYKGRLAGRAVITF